MRLDAAVGAYTHRAGSRTPGCVYGNAQVAGGCVYMRGSWNLQLATCNLQLVCVRSGGARIFRYWSRYTQVGAYTRKCNGCVPRTYAGAGIVRSGKFARGPSTDRVRSTRRQADTRPTPAAAHDAVHDASFDGPAPHAPQGIWDAVRTLHSADAGGGTFAQPRALSQRPQTAIRESPYRCATGLLCQPHAAWTL